MQQKVFMVLAYFRYLLKSGSRHSVHSPFVYSLIDKVFKNTENYPDFLRIKDRRNHLIHKSRLIEITDFGVGSKRKKYEHRFESVSSIARKSSVTEKYGRLIYRMVEHFKPKTIVELGTCLGISTLYMAMANPEARVFTVEGCTTKAEQASRTFDALQVSNIIQQIGRFEIVMPDLIKQAGKLDFAFIDGNHTYEATLNYFNALLEISHNETIFIFDDIHWSAGMEQAWNKIIQHEQVTVSIDIFRMGIVFIKTELSKQNFVIRF